MPNTGRCPPVFVVLLVEWVTRGCIDVAEHPIRLFIAVDEHGLRGVR